MLLTPDQKGSIAEAEIVACAVRLRIGVFRPVTDGERCDLIFRLRRSLLRVQCKTAANRGDVLAISCFSSRRSSTGFVNRPYDPDEVDAIAAYCPMLDRAYLLELALFGRRTYIQLRLSPARNNQRKGINWASNFEFAATLGRLVGP